MMAAGSVRTHAITILRIVAICSPEPLAAIAPATPDDSTCVVETGRANKSAAPSAAGGDQCGGCTLRVSKMRLADLLPDSHDDALPADHGAKAERERHGALDPCRD